MAFGNVAGRAGFVLGLDKRELDTGLPAAERQFDQSTSSMAASATRAGEAIGTAGGGVGLAGRLGALGSVLGRAGLVGVGISTAISAMDELQTQLTVTGREAFTTEGKLRNMSAALLQGNLIGGIKALSAAPKTVDELGISAQEASGRLDALRQVATGQAAALREMARAGENNAGATDEQKRALDEYNRIVKEAGTGNMEFANQLLDQGRAWKELDLQMRGALNSMLAFRDAQGQVVLPGGFAGLRPQPARVPPGQSILGPGAVPTPPTPVRSLPSILSQREREAARTPGLNDDLAVARDIAAFAKRRLDLVKQEGPLMEKRRQEYQDALDKVDAAQDSIARDAAARAEERQRKAEQAAAERLRKQKATAAELLRKRKERAERAKQAAEEAERQWEEVQIALTGPSTWQEALAARSEALNAMHGLQSKAAVAKTEAGLSVADVRRMQVDFLTSLQGVTNQFGSNVTADGPQMATNTWQTARLMQEQNGILRALTRGVAHPGAKYARMELMEPFGGVGGV